MVILDEQQLLATQNMYDDELLFDKLLGQILSLDDCICNSGKILQQPRIGGKYFFGVFSRSGQRNSRIMRREIGVA